MLFVLPWIFWLIGVIGIAVLIHDYKKEELEDSVLDHTENKLNKDM